MKTIEIIKNNPVNNVFTINFAGLNFVNGNREVENIEHVSEIEEAMKRGDFIPPIIVDESTLTIIDGQHRYIAACNIWRKGGQYNLTVILHKFDNPLLAAINYNSKSKKWNTDNYVNAYIIDGRESFKLLKKFCEEHPLFIGNNFGSANINYIGAAQLLTGTPCSCAIPRGTLTITEQQCIEGDKIYKELEQLVNITNCKALIQRYHVLAWLETREFILSKMTLDKFSELMKKYFVAPSVSSKKTWIAEYLRVVMK